MIHKSVLLGFLMISFFRWSQDRDLTQIDNIVSYYQEFSSVEELAKKIDYDFTTDLEKARAAFTWIATNIDYINKNVLEVGNTKFYIVTDEEDYQRRIKKEDAKTVERVFRDRKALCKGYALVFQKICDLLQIENEIILGYIKNSSHGIGFVPSEKNHAWNAIKIQDIWIFLDITMGSGYSYRGVWQSRFNEAFFDIKKEVIRNTHYPQEDTWHQYLGSQSLEAFSELPFYSKAYFKDNFEIVNHKSGEIKTKKRKSIVMKVKGIDFGTKVYYKYGELGKLQSAEALFDGTLTRVNIESPKDNTILKIFFDGEEAISYKVILEE